MSTSSSVPLSIFRVLFSLICRPLHRPLMARFMAWFAALCLPAAVHAAAAVPDDINTALNQGQSVDVIVEYEASDVDKEVTAARSPKDRFETTAITSLRATRYAAIKKGVDTALARSDITSLQDYSHLPMAFKRVRSAAALKSLLSQPRIKAIYANKALHHVSVPANLSLIAQPATHAVGYDGSGSTVAVLDDGIDYTNSAFGGCTAPGTPSTCQVSVSTNFGSGTTDTSHGTNVSAIVLGVAPAAKIAMLNVFSGTSAYTSNIISAMNWAISNRNSYNIVAINMSLGDGSQHTSTCSSGNPYLTPTNNARNAGITVVAAAGNDAYSNAMGLPACTPGIVSVGAVYADNYDTGYTWGNNLCTDYSTAPDKIACFSDSASFMTLWAPGALITAAGITEGGTSQASPHVAGAVAMLRAAFPSDSLNTTLNRLTTSRTQITDARNGLTKPRLDLAAAARPANDNFSAAITLSGNSGSASGTNLLGTIESGEPQAVSNESGQTVWWTWTAPANGQVSLNTHGSNFDTLLTVYTGNAVGALQTVASNDNDGSSGNTSGLLFEAVSGTSYRIAVDGIGGAQGSISLAWALNTSAQANLGITGISGPGSITANSTVTYAIGVNNSGPQAATNVVLTLNLPSGVSLLNSSSPCQGSTGQITCTLGTLANGAATSLSINLLWDTVGTQNLSASVTSDLPHSSTSNNTASDPVTAQIAPADIADTPTLPQWAAMALGCLLLINMARLQAKRRS